MFNWSILDAAISLVAVYIAFSLLVSWIQEEIAKVTKLRSKTLWSGIEQIVGDATLRDKLYGHPAIDAPTDPTSARNPSYISAQQFSTALIGVLNARSPVAAGAKTDIADLQRQVGALNLQTTKVGEQISALWTRAEGDWDRFVACLETWFDDEMDRLSGWYKRAIAPLLFGLSIAVCAFFNVDTIALVKSFAAHPIPISANASPQDVSRAAFANIALGWVNVSCAAIEAQIHPDKAQSGAPQLTVANPSDYSTRCLPAGGAWASKILGIVLTSIALMLGAPFWFDVLQQLINVRSNGPKPKSTYAASRVALNYEEALTSPRSGYSARA